MEAFLLSIMSFSKKSDLQSMDLLCIFFVINLKRSLTLGSNLTGGLYLSLRVLPIMEKKDKMYYRVIYIRGKIYSLATA